jgi:pyruvate/2-oxoglutarate dehydrogenase complex dihydrolipoamide dehydrogenase (E3) component
MPEVAMAPAKGDGTYNVVVIGGGTAGLVTAAATAALGGRVALVEKGRMGGDCLNTGCVPSKSLLSSARLVAQIRRAPEWGLDPQEPRFDFARVLESMRERRARIAPHDSQERFESLGVDVVRAHARFLSPREVQAGELRLRARNFVVATGSRPAIPPIDGLAEARPYTSETIFDELRVKPDRLIILGGGPMGCELGQAFARLGVQVTIVEMAARILEKEDEEAADVVRRRLEAEGVRVMTGERAQGVSRQGGRLRVEVQAAGGGREALQAEALLVAAGRVPNAEDLGLDAAGVAHDGKGIRVDERLQTSQPHIYAAGDVTGGYQFTHVADEHARTIVRNILLPWPKKRVDQAVLPWCTYTSPEVARVGLNEAEARRRGVAHDVWVHPLNGVDRAVVEREEEGFVKILTAKGGDRVLGVTMVGERAGDLVHELVLAMRNGVGLRGVSGTIHAYPTLAEAARKAADLQQKARLTPLALKLFTWLYRRRRGGA